MEDYVKFAILTSELEEDIVGSRPFRINRTVVNKDFKNANKRISLNSALSVILSIK